MYRIRFHGRGGQVMKTASRLLGTAFFLQGYEVQDAPRYGAERRDAPMSAYVRADHNPIYERGIINKPDLVVVADDSLIAIPAAGVLKGLDKKTDFLYICYDNEGYGNTGQQFSEATPYTAKTATSRGPRGYPGFKKDLFSLWIANKPAYVATVIGSEPLDLSRKIEKARDLNGPRLIISLSPCPTGWNFDPKATAAIGKLAVKTGIWPLKEYIDGKVTHTKHPLERLPVEEYLKLQGRFAHLFTPTRNEKMLQEIQNKVDQYSNSIEKA